MQGIILTSEVSGGLPSLSPSVKLWLKRCKYVPVTGEGETVKEEISLVLEGTRAEIERL